MQAKFSRFYKSMQNVFSSTVDMMLLVSELQVWGASLWKITGSIRAVSTF